MPRSLKRARLGASMIRYLGKRASAQGNAARVRRSFPRLAWLALLAVSWVPTNLHAQNVFRLEIRPIETLSLKREQILRGDREGQPTLIAGELRIPTRGTDRLAAVVLLNDSGGVGAGMNRWAQELNSIGVAAFLIDSFSGRSITSTASANDAAQLDSLAMIVDAYRALDMLTKHPRIDPNRIAVMGFSKGAVAATYSSNRRFQQVYAPAGAQFAAHIGLYTPCHTTYHGDEQTTGKPLRLFHGQADDYVSVEPCRDYVARLKRAGIDAALTEYPDAMHLYDAPLLAQPLKLPNAETQRNCRWREAKNGVIVNAKTGKPYSLDDPCVEYGPHLGYNRAAAEANEKAVKEFLTTTFKLPIGKP